MHDTGIGAPDLGIAMSGQIPPNGPSLESEGLYRALLYSISHDLRTPLTAIRTIAAALRSADLDMDQRDAMLADVDHEAERLARLLSNLLEASRVEAGALRPTLVRVPVEELCRAAVNDARAALGSRLVEIDLEPHLTPVEVDETMIPRPPPPPAPPPRPRPAGAPPPRGGGGGGGGGLAVIPAGSAVGQAPAG